MSAHPPPVPPEQRNPHETPESDTAGSQADRDNRLNRNLDEQGRQGNVKQNTTNTGYQQDR